MAGQQRRGATPGNQVAVAERPTLSKLIEARTGDLGAIMPEHVKPDAFVGLAIAYVRRDEKLREAADANPASLFLALRECAALGHVPLPEVYALVPYNDKRAPGGKTVVGIETYRGVIERMFRAGGVRSIHVEVGREGDAVLSFNRTRDRLPRHEYDEFATDAQRGPLKAVYAWAEMLGGGTSYVAWLNAGEVLKHRSASRSGDAFWGPPWPGEGPWTAAMWRKTALHVLEPYVPTSAAYRWQLSAAEAAAGRDTTWGVDQGAILSPYRAVGDELGDDTIQDAELVDDGPAPAEVDGWPQTAQPGAGERP